MWLRLPEKSNGLVLGASIDVSDVATPSVLEIEI
jgi:hypothetical protein